MEDAPALHGCRYPDMSVTEIEDMIAAWNQKQIDNRYFEMLAVWQGEMLVGMLSLYGLTAAEVSIGPEVFPSCRRNGFAKAAMELACKRARKIGYKTVLQQIRTDNTASIALHRSLGFVTDGISYRNAKGNQVCTFTKLLM